MTPRTTSDDETPAPSRWAQAVVALAMLCLDPSKPMAFGLVPPEVRGNRDGMCLPARNYNRAFSPLNEWGAD